MKVPKPVGEQDRERTASVGPRCPSCGSAKLHVPGFVSFHWHRGRLVPKRGTEMLNETGAPLCCQECGGLFEGNYEPPYDLVPAPSDEDAADRRRG